MSISISSRAHHCSSDVRITTGKRKIGRAYEDDGGYASEKGVNKEIYDRRWGKGLDMQVGAKRYTTEKGKRDEDMQVEVKVL